MFHFFGAITNKKGDALVGYFVRLTDTSNNAVSLYSDNNGTPIINVSGVANAALVDSDGNASFYVQPGTYNLLVYAADSTTLYQTIASLPLGLNTITLASGSAASTRSQMADIELPVSGQSAILTESGREGTFVFDSANHSAHVTADPNQGLYVAPSSDPTGASGAWVRTSWANAGSQGIAVVPLTAGTSSVTKTANLAAFAAGLDMLSSLYGGGTLIVPQGIFYFSDEIPVGDGTNTSQSTKHHNIRIVGAGKGSSPSVSNVQTLAPTVLRYGGSADTTKAVINLQGPLHGIQIENIELDANGLAGIGLKTNHVDDFVYRNVIVRNWTTNSYVFTTRTGFPTGVGHGCGNASLYDCYAYDPASNSANGLLLTSGVSTATTLVGNPDTANMDIYGGVLFYGGSTGTSGIEFAGCDNNSYNGTQFIPAGGNDGGGFSHKWTQWPGSTWFPGGNQLRQGGFSQGMTGTAGTGGNMAWFDNSDSGYIPNITGLSVQLTDGSRYVNGQRSYSVYSISTAQLNFSTQTTTSATIVDVPGLVLPLTYPAGSKLRLSFTGVAAKDTTGTGDFYLNHNGSDYGPSLARIEATGYAASVASELLLDLPSAGTAVNSKVRFQSDGTNGLHIQNASFIATVLY